MAITTKTGTPSEIRSGDTLTYTLTFGDYPASAWDLIVYFNKEGQGARSEAATASGDDFIISLSAAETSQFAPGKWRWFARASKQGEGEIIADQGEVLILPDPAADPEKTFAERMLAECRAVIAKRAGMAYSASDIGGASFTHKTDAELREAERHWVARVKAERARRRYLEDGRPDRQGRIWLK